MDINPSLLSKNPSLPSVNLPIDMKTECFGKIFKNPVIAASGTFGFGSDYKQYYDPSILGGICTKGLTLERRAGNSGRRIIETPSGIMNSIGLENPGIEDFLKNELVQMKEMDTVILANLGGSSLKEYQQGAQLIQQHNDRIDLYEEQIRNRILKENADIQRNKDIKTNTDIKRSADFQKSSDVQRKIDIIELNISCPNVKQGGIAFGITAEEASKAVKIVREAVSIPVVVKLSPNAHDIVSVAVACEQSGADGLSLINTISSLEIDIYKRKAVFENIYAGLSGPAIKPIALKMTREVSNAVSIPVIGIGGIVTFEDAIAFIMAGAHLIQFGTASFINPYAGRDIVLGIQSFMEVQGINSLDEIRGII